MPEEKTARTDGGMLSVVLLASSLLALGKDAVVSVAMAQD